MELFLRNAYGLPLHDVEHERDIVRQRLWRLEKRMPSLGSVGAAAAHYTLGRGYLALGNASEAREHLEMALQLGYAAPELREALGRAFGELYKKALDETKRIGDDKEREARVKQLQSELMEPALGHLRAAVGSQIDVPAYAEGLIAFYSGNHDEALKKAKEAFEQAPWLYEAKKLEGDALQARGDQYRHDSGFDYEKLMNHLEPAADAYSVATNIGSSDPDVLIAACEYWRNVMLPEIESGKNAEGTFEKLNAACVRAAEASSKDPRAHIHLAMAHVARAFYAAQGALKSSDQGQWIAEAIRLAEAARAAAPDNSMAHYVVAGAYECLTMHRFYRMEDPSASSRRAIAAYEDVIRMEPGHSWAQTELVGAWVFEMRSKSWREPAEDGIAAAAFRAADQAVAVTPQSPFVWGNKAKLHEFVGRFDMEQGKDPREHYARALEVFEKVLQMNPNVWHSHNDIAEAHAFRAEYEVLAGDDPSASLRAAKAEAQRAVETGGGGSMTIDTAGFVSLNEARYLLREGRDPTQAAVEARNAFRKASEFAPWNAPSAENRILTEIVALRWAMRQHQATAEMFDVALAPAKPFLAQGVANPLFYVDVAHVHALRAAWLLDSKKNPSTDIEQGLALVTKAHRLNPHQGRGYAMQGHLLLTKAKAAKDASAKRNGAIAAKGAFGRAFKEMPILEKEYGDPAKEAATLAE